MKKILYSVAMATLAVSAVSAAKPTKMAPVAPQAKLARANSAMMLEKPVVMRNAGPSFTSLGDYAKAHTPIITADGEGDTPATGALNALYSNAEASFYIAISPYVDPYICYGLTGYKNGIVWRNRSTGADSYEWSYGEVVAIDATTGAFTSDGSTSTDENLVMDLTPGSIYVVPTLTAKSGSETAVYQADDVRGYFCGGWPVDYGFGVDEATGEPDFDYVPGVSNYAHQLRGLTGVSYFSTSTIDTKNYDSNGMYKQRASYFKGNDKFKYSNYKTFAYASFIPAKPSPYMLESVFADIVLSCTEDVVLTAKVYLLDDKGFVDLENPLGGGELSFSKGTFPASDEEPLPIFTLYAYDSDGYETDNPVCIPTATSCYVTLEGVDNPAINAFMLGVQMGFETPMSMLEDPGLFDYIGYMTPTHAFALMNVDVEPVGGEKYTAVDAAPCPGIFGNEDETGLFYPSDFSMFYNVYFPMVVNVTEGSDDYGTGKFNVTMPVEGGETTIDVSPEYNIVSLIDEGIMTAQSSDWIKFEPEVVTDDRGSYVRVSISADALPADEEGRQGYVAFRGYACDFEIIVNQGEVAGISTVPAAANGKVELYDLQGRKLSAVPAHGIYLERQGNKTVKRIAK